MGRRDAPRVSPRGPGAGGEHGRAGCDLVAAHAAEGSGLAATLLAPSPGYLGAITASRMQFEKVAGRRAWATGPEPKELWRNKNICNQFSSSVLIGDHLYGVSGNTGGGNLVCLDLVSGKKLWEERSVKGGSLVLAWSVSAVALTRVLRSAGA